MMTYLVYIGIFFILYGLIKQGAEEFFYDLAIAGAHTIAFIIKVYFKVKRWLR